MDIKGYAILGLLGIVLLTQLPTVFCALEHYPSGGIEQASQQDFGAQINSLVRCMTPTSRFGIILFIVGGAAAALLPDSR